MIHKATFYKTCGGDFNSGRRFFDERTSVSRHVEAPYNTSLQVGHYRSMDFVFLIWFLEVPKINRNIMKV